MKVIEAVVHQLKLAEVRKALGEAGVEEYSESTMVCHAHHKGRSMMFRGAELVSDREKKVKVEVIAADDSVERIIDALRPIAVPLAAEGCRIGVHPYRQVV